MYAIVIEKTPLKNPLRLGTDFGSLSPFKNIQMEFKIMASGPTKDPLIFWAIVQKKEEGTGLYLSCFLKSAALIPVGKKLTLDPSMMKWKY